MSNTRHTREWNGGKLTRPRSRWHGHARGTGRSPLAADMQQQTAGHFASMLTALSGQYAALRRSALSGNANSRKGS